MNILLSFHQNDWRRYTMYQPEKYFSAMNHDVFTAAIEMTPYWTNWNHRLPFYFPKGVPTSVQTMERKFQTQFDLVIEFDSTGQYHLLGMKQIKAPTVLWSGDMHLYSKRRFQMYFQNDFDIVFTMHKDCIPFFKKTECRWLPPYCDPDIHKKIDLPKIYDIGFVGTVKPDIYPERAQLLESLSKKYKVGIFNKNAYGPKMIEVFNQSKIVFNKSHSSDLNFRVFESLSCGSFLLTDRIQDGLPELFEDGKHLVMYDDLQDLEKKVDYYLTHTDEREKIAACGQKEVHEKHSFYNRAKTIIESAEKFRTANE